MYRKVLPAFALTLCSLLPICLAAQAPTQAPSSASELAPPAHPATAEQVREYLILTNYVPNAHKLMSQMLSGSRATSAPFLTAAFWDDMDKSIQEIDLVGPAIPAYQKFFSEEDMAATIVFYKSHAGQKLLAAQPYIVSAASDVLRAVGQKVGQEVYARHKDEIEAARKKAEPTPAAPPKQP
jgi:hypothetical protein